MSEALVLPCFNRFYPQVVSEGPFGIIAYATRNVINFVDVRRYPPVILDGKCIYRAHKDRIVAISFCKCENTELIASISESGEVKIWDIKTLAALNSYSVNEGVCNIEWIHGSPNFLVFPKDTKFLIKWNFSTSTASKIKISDLRTCYITSNEKCPNLLAIGHHNGSITVIDIVQEKVLQKFKDHTKEINILTWSPVSPDTLLSVCSDYSVRSWNINETKSTKSYWIGRPKPEDRRRIRVMGICHPKKADVIICSNPQGDIGEVVLSEEKPRFKSYSKMDAAISCRCLHAMFASSLQTEHGTIDIVYCFDSFHLSIWNITEKKLLSFLQFLMGYIYDLSFSSVNPIHLSIGNGDGFLQIFNAQSDSLTSRLTSIFVQSRIKIMSAAWHPTLENIVAFGTDDGKLGIIDTIKRKSQYPYTTFHTSKVYTVCWGPYKASETDDAGSEYYIYSCGGLCIYINRYKKLNEQGLDFHELVTRPADITTAANLYSEISWKSDYSCVCVGTHSGFVDLYDDNLVFLTHFDLELTSVESLKWHPESTYMSPTGSPLKFWLACGGQDINIYIVDTSKIFEKNENPAVSVVKKLTGHKKNINDICWSPHMDGYIVSCSMDGSAMVWNACTGNVIASFLNHFAVVNAVQWSMLDEDIIYSGGHDSCVRVWRISEQTTVTPPSKTPIRKHLKRSKPPIKKEKLQDSEDEIVSKNENAILKRESILVETSEKNLNKVQFTEITGNENTAENVTTIHGKVKHIDRHNQAFWFSHGTKVVKPLFGNSINDCTKEEDLKDCIKLADILCKGTQEIDESFDPFKPISEVLSDEDCKNLGLYLDQITALRMADIQADELTSEKDESRFCQISIMTNKVQKLIKEATVNGTLSNYLVSLAPSVSYSFWLETCEKYALQLLQEKEPYLACTYFLMCNKIYEAIDILSEKNRFIDALALAKLRLPESDPLIKKLLHLIRKRFHFAKNSPGEAKCYLTLNKPLQAVKSLGSEPNTNCIKVAAYICKKYNMNDEAERYKLMFVQRCLVQCDWEIFREFANQEPSLQVYSILFAVHEALYAQIRRLKKQTGIIMKQISLPNSEELIKFWYGATCPDSDKSFMEHLCDILASKNLLPATENSLGDIIKSLDTFSTKWDVLDSSTDTHVAIAVNITKFILLTTAGDSATATAIFFKIFEISNNIGYLPRIVFRVFFPLELLWSRNKKSIICQSNIHNMESNMNLVLTHYHQIVQCVSEKILIKLHPFDLTIISKENLRNNLQSVTEKIVASLSKKDCSEFIVAYFVSYIVHDLSRLMTKKVLVLECLAKRKNPESVVCSKTEAEVLLNDETETQKIESSDLKALIDVALEEANEKIRKLTISGASIDTADTSCNLFQIVDIPDSCSYKVHSNDEEICENKVDINIDNEECKIISKDEENVGNCIQVHSSDNSHVQNIDNEECEIVLKDEENVGNSIQVHSSDDSHVQNIDNEECEIVSKDEYCVEICSTENVGNCVQVHSSDNSHIQCIESIDIFYNLISFLMFNICKDEFILLYYLKEHLKFLNLARASHMLSKFSEGNKASLNQSESSSEIKEAISQEKTGEPKITPDLYAELIHLLDLKEKGISYPNPFDIIPKVLQILYDVRQKSTCSFIQEKLHKLIDDIVHWAETFQVANINFVCAICH